MAGLACTHKKKTIRKEGFLTGRNDMLPGGSTCSSPWYDSIPNRVKAAGPFHGDESSACHLSRMASGAGGQQAMAL